MFLLNAPPIPKDASKAVKRVSPDFGKIITPETLTELLSLPNMLVSGFFLEKEENNEHLHLFCEHQYQIAICPCCQIASEALYEKKKKRSVRHLDVWGKRTIIHFNPRRFECDVCGKPFTQQLDWLEPKRRQTIPFENYIYQRVLKTPRKHVALQEGLSESTVLKIFKQQAKRATRTNSDRDQKIRVLGVDEISLRKGHKQYALVISDLERRCVVAILENRLKDTFEKWLDALPEDELKAIKVVSMDMWEPYRQAVRTKLPWADIVADRFHVVKQLNRQLNLLRRKVQREADKELAELLKGCRWILLKPRRNLSAKEEAKLQKILDDCPELRTIYLLKENFRTIGDKIKDKKRAERFLKVWVYEARATGIRYLKKFAKTLQNWWEEFLNYFDEGITQGFVEGTNRAIRGIINRAFGFRNFENFRLQVLAEHGPP